MFKVGVVKIFVVRNLPELLLNEVEI